MQNKKDLSIINCLATAMLAYFLTVPVHELFHMLTHYVYGGKVLFYSAAAVRQAEGFDYMNLSAFNRIMIAGGSASILNVIIGIILIIIVLKATMGPTVRLFLIQLMGAHLSVGVGYFMIGGLFGAGDWGNVFRALADQPGLVSVLRIVLSIVGCLGIVGVFFLLNYTSYYFIEDTGNRKERLSVAFRLHLLMLIVGFPIGMIVTILSPARINGELSIGLGALYNFMWIPFLWGFLFTGVMVRPPKKSRFLYRLPSKPNWILFAVAVMLILVDIFVFGPGIKLN